jgi:hypothetical protein
MMHVYTTSSKHTQLNLRPNETFCKPVRIPIQAYYEIQGRGLSLNSSTDN